MPVCQRVPSVPARVETPRALNRSFNRGETTKNLIFAFDVPMNNNSESLLAVLKREPEQTSFLLKFGLGGPVVIVVADWLASTFLPAVAVVPILLALLVASSAVLVLLVARLVHSADRWKVESADTATRLMANRRRASQPPAEPAAAQPLMASGVEEPPMDDPGADPPPAAQPYEEPMVAEPEGTAPPPVAPEPSFHQP